jgi:hypothetical protein
MDLMLRRIAIAFGLLLAIPLVVVPAWIATHRSDLPTPNDEDLAVQLSELRKGDNGFDDLVAAAELLDWPRDGDYDKRLDAIRAGESCEPAWVEEMLTRDARAMAALHRALKAPAMQLPPYLDPEAGMFGTLFAAERLVNLAGAEARLQLDRGDRDRAIERAMFGMRLGKRISGAEGIELSPMMFVVRLQAMSLADLEAVVRRIPLDAPAAGELVAQLDSARWTAEDWRRMWAGEYQQVLKPIILEFEPSRKNPWWTPLGWPWRLIPEAYLWQPNRTLSSMSDVYRKQQHRSALDCSEAYAQPLREDDGYSWLAKVIVSQNPLGNLMAWGTATPTVFLDTKRCHLEAKIELLRTLIGSKAYWDTHGRLPSSLADLVPRYLPDLPHDRFGGKELAYSEARKLAYSVGEDFLDDGGGDPPSPSDATEPAISLAF